MKTTQKSERFVSLQIAFFKSYITFFIRRRCSDIFFTTCDLNIDNKLKFKL